MSLPQPLARNEFRNKVLFGIIALLAFIFLIIVVVVFLLPAVAPAPVEFDNNPSPIASNPANPDQWDFSNADPTLHPGDALIAQVVACVINPFGPTVHVSGFRRLVSVDGLITDSLDATDTTVANRPCSTSDTNVGNIPITIPGGRYRVEATASGSTTFYTRDSHWWTIWFEIANP